VRLRFSFVWCTCFTSISLLVCGVIGGAAAGMFIGLSLKRVRPRTDASFYSSGHDALTPPQWTTFLFLQSTRVHTGMMTTAPHLQPTWICPTVITSMTHHHGLLYCPGDHEYKAGSAHPHAYDPQPTLHAPPTLGGRSGAIIHATTVTTTTLTLTLSLPVNVSRML